MTSGSSPSQAPPARRFAFGRNWLKFLAQVDEPAIADARDHLAAFLGTADLAGQRFLDLGSGSGLMSLAARRLGAAVVSFDYDPDSVRASELLRERLAPGDPAWTVLRGDALDQKFLAGLGSFAVVYSWGVLHHTGDLWRAVANAAALVAPGGLFYLALYNDQGWISRYWRGVKRRYNQNAFWRGLFILLHLPHPLGLPLLKRALTGRLRERARRGMGYWRDYLDWLGGWPFQVAAPAEVRDFLAARGFGLARERLVGRRQGCNEFLFRRGGN